MANEQYFYIMKWKLPEFLFSFIKDGRGNEIMESMNIDEVQLLQYLSAEEFPTDNKLKGFCDHFNLRYSALKTWNILHMETNL